NQACHSHSLSERIRRSEADAGASLDYWRGQAVTSSTKITYNQNKKGMNQSPKQLIHTLILTKNYFNYL
ncbi:MAG: hypothetical protein ACTTKP_05935, partial [Catonella sp.]|uniref:hypothetical protein n=1 Tax=Catonella sp. TaxID=2382125 RepID=UPI003FA0D59D